MTTEQATQELDEEVDWEAVFTEMRECHMTLEDLVAARPDEERSLLEVRIQREKVTPELLQEMHPLLERHYGELAHFPEDAFEMDRDRYLAIEEAGHLRVFTLRMGERLWGYAMFIVSPSLRNPALFQAHQDALFLEPACRGLGLGRRLLSYCDQSLQGEGVQAVYHSTAAQDFGPLLIALGYKRVGHIYARRF